MDSLANSERRVSFWQQDAQETLSNSIKIGLVIKCFEKGCSRDHLLINTGEKNTQLVPMDMSAMGSHHQKFQGNFHGVEFIVTWRETVERTLNTCKTIKQVDGLARTKKPKASLARTNPQISGEKGSLARANARTKAMERANNTARKERKDFTRWMGVTGWLVRYFCQLFSFVVRDCHSPQSFV